MPRVLHVQARTYCRLITQYVMVKQAEISPVKTAATRKNAMKINRPMDAWPTGMPA